MLEEYSEYILEIKYYIVWYLDLYKRYEQEVNVNTFAHAIEDMDKDNEIPYSIKLKYFVKYKGSSFIEVNKEVYAELYKWQHNKRFHEIYEIRKHRDLYNSIEIEEIEQNFNLEDEIIRLIEEEFLQRKLKRILTPSQYEIAYSLIFEEKSQSEIARDKHISRQAVNCNLSYIRKKLKKF